MYRRILVGYLDTEPGRDALALGTSLTQASGAELMVVTADDRDGEDLAQIARSQSADLIVLGATHRGQLGKVISGATMDGLLADAPCDVAIAPPGFGSRSAASAEWRPLDGNGRDAGMRVIGVGYDGSDGSKRGLAVATEMALANGAALRVFTVAGKPHLSPTGDQPPAPGVPTEDEAMREELHEAVRALPSEVRALPVFLRGFAADELIGAAKLGVDLLVLGCRGGGGLRRLFHTSVSGTVVEKTKCPVLITPRAVAARAPAVLAEAPA